MQLRLVAFALACGAAGGLAPVALAEADDASYCTALAGKYNTYVSSSLDRHPHPPPADVSTAMTKCRSDAQAAIPVLEKALHNARIDLPPRG